MAVSLHTLSTIAENIASFQPEFSARVFVTMSSEVTLGDNTLEFSIFRFFFFTEFG